MDGLVKTNWRMTLTVSVLLVCGACKSQPDTTEEGAAMSTRAQAIESAPASQPVSEPVEEQESTPRGEADDVEAPPSVPRIDHARFDALLKAHVNPETGMVDYDAFKASEEELDAYLTQVIATADLEPLSEEEAFAFYVNAYNAYTIKLILERYPKLKSIRDYKEPWKQERWEVAGETLSLDQIEHTKLRPVYKDPRIHFAVNCASIGCPPLRAEAYTGEALESQLEAATKHTLSSSKYVEVKKGKLYLTQLLEWYGGDFTNPEFKGHEESVAQYVAKYAGEDVAALVGEKGAKTSVVFKDYDWKLNKQ